MTFGWIYSAGPLPYSVEVDPELAAAGQPVVVHRHDVQSPATPSVSVTGGVDPLAPLFLPENSRAAVFDLSRVDFSGTASRERRSLSKKRRAKIKLERELKFLIRRSSLESLIPLHTLPSRFVCLRYFPPEHIAAAQNIAERILGQPAPPGFLATHARLREVESPFERRAFLELKGPKRGPQQTRVERDELSVSLVDEQDVQQLLPLATLGFLHKQRFRIMGWVSAGSGQQIPLRVNVDRILAAGRSFETQHQAALSLPFLFADVEFKKRGLIWQFRRGQHSFDFLRTGLSVEISHLPPEVRRLFSMRRLSRKGVDRTLLTASESLLPGL